MFHGSVEILPLTQACEIFLEETYVSGFWEEYLFHDEVNDLDEPQETTVFDTTQSIK